MDATGARSRYFLVVALCLCVADLTATWTYEQNFDSLSDSPLHGQDSWVGFNASGQVLPRVQTKVTYAGEKAVVVELSTHATIDRALPSPLTDGAVYAVLRKTQTGNTDLYVVLRESSANSNRGFLRMGADGNLSIYNGGASTYVSLLAYTANEWYPVNLEFDVRAHPNQYRARVHAGGSWGAFSAWYDVNGGSYRSIDTLRLDTDHNSGSAAGHFGYYDEIGSTDPTRRQTAPARAGIGFERTP